MNRNTQKAKKKSKSKKKRLFLILALKIISRVNVLYKLILYMVTTANTDTIETVKTVLN